MERLRAVPTSQLKRGAAAAVVALLAVGVATVVSAHGGDTTRIHSCVNANSGTILIVGPDGTCQRNETPLDWNTQGVPGPQGPTGAQGVPGPPSVTGYEVIQGQTAVDTTPEKIIEVKCPVGKKPLGGGAAARMDPGAALLSSQPTHDRLGWSAFAEKMTGPTVFWDLAVFVICATVAP